MKHYCLIFFLFLFILTIFPNEKKIFQNNSIHFKEKNSNESKIKNHAIRMKNGFKLGITGVILSPFSLISSAGFIFLWTETLNKFNFSKNFLHSEFYLNEVIFGIEGWALIAFPSIFLIIFGFARYKHFQKKADELNIKINPLMNYNYKQRKLTIGLIFKR